MYQNIITKEKENDSELVTLIRLMVTIITGTGDG